MNNNKTMFKKIKSVISHPLKEKLYEIKTSYGRSIKITSSHSIFVYEDDKIKLKKGDEIKNGDLVVAPKNLPLDGDYGEESIDILDLYLKNIDKIKDKLYLRGFGVEELYKERILKKYGDNHKLTAKRVVIPKDVMELMESRRR